MTTEDWRAEAPGTPAVDDTPAGRSGGLAAVARGSVAGVAGAAVNASVGFLLAVVITRALGPAGAGMLFAATAAFSIASITGEMGSRSGVMRALSRSLAVGRSDELAPLVLVALVPVVALTVIFAVVVWLAAPVIATGILPDAPVGDATQMIRLLAVVLPFSSVSLVALAGTRGLGDLGPMVLLENVAKPVIRLVLCAGVAVAGGGVLVMLSAWALPVVIGTVAAAILLRRSLRRRGGPGRGAAREGWRPLAGPFWLFCFPRAGSSFIEVVSGTVGLLLVSSLAGSQEAGVLAAVMRYVLVGMLALQAVRLILAPEVSGMIASGRLHEVEHVHRISATWIAAGAWPLYLTMIIFPHTLLGLFGAEFRVGALTLVVVSAAMLVNLATGNVATVLVMSGRSGAHLAATVVALVAHVALILMLVPRHGVLGAGLAWGTSSIIENALVVVAVRRWLGVRTFSEPMVRLAVACAVCFLVPGAVLRATLGASGVALVGYLFASAVLYAVVLWRWRESLELRELVGVLRRRSARS